MLVIRSIRPCYLTSLALLAMLTLPVVTNAQALPNRSNRASSLLSPSEMPGHPAVVRVFVSEKDTQSIGSGTLIDVRDQVGLIVTNWHVVRDANGAITVAFPDGFRSTARVVKVDEAWDLAALSIWRPKASPVAISSRLPQVGETLMIAGYGSEGVFRAASGKVTQYMAPSEKHPAEIIEIGVTARQGDSGGPMLDAQGQLAGVLFGTVAGTTSGSYGGRVQQFLQPLINPNAPGVSPSPSIEAAKPMVNLNESFTNYDHLVKPEASAVKAAAPLAPIDSVDPTQAVESEESARFVHTPFEMREDIANQNLPPAPLFANSDLQKVIGNTPVEQAKSALAILGILSLVRFAFRLGGSSSRKAPEPAKAAH